MHCGRAVVLNELGPGKQRANIFHAEQINEIRHTFQAARRRTTTGQVVPAIHSGVHCLSLVE